MSETSRLLPHGETKHHRNYSDIDDGEQKEERKVLYESLPFIAAFGMQSKESNVRKVISTVRLSQLVENEMKSLKELENTSDRDMDRVILTLPLVLAVIVASIAQFLVGFNTSLLNLPTRAIFSPHNPYVWALVVAAYPIGAPFGAVFGGKLSNWYGRKFTILLSTWIFLFGGLIMVLAFNVFWFLPARLLSGFAAGAASVVVPVYLGEIAPPTMRGLLGTVVQFALVTGIFVSNLIAIPLATPQLWRYLMSIDVILCVLLLLFSRFLLDSPRWLLSKDNESERAREVIKELRGYRTREQVQIEVQNFISASAIHKTIHYSAHSMSAMSDLFRTPTTRVLIIATIVMQVLQQFSGGSMMYYYSSQLLESGGDGGLHGFPVTAATALISLVNVLANYLVLQLLPVMQRRTLMLCSSIGLLVASVLATLVLFGVLNRIFLILSLLLLVASYALGLGPIPLLIIAEMFENRYVATAMSLNMIVNWVSNAAAAFLFPVLMDFAPNFAFLPFLLVAVASLVFTSMYLPETFGRTTETLKKSIVLALANQAFRKQQQDETAVPSSPAIRGRSKRSNSNAKQRHEVEEDLEMPVPIIQQVELGSF